MATNVNSMVRDGVTFVLVHTTNTSAPNPAEILITANLRETAKQTVKDDQRYRNVCIPEFSLPEVEDRFRKVLIEKFVELAKSFLEDKMDESARMMREIPQSSFSIDSLLGYAARVAVSGRMTGEQVAAWFDTSHTGQYIKEKVQGTDAEKAAQVKKYRDLFVKTASPNHGINPNTCTALLATMRKEDTETTVGAALATKWQATITKSSASEIDSL